MIEDGDRASPVGRSKTPARRTVAGRLLVSYVVVLVAFAITVGWSFMALRSATQEAEQLRAGYVPLSLELGQVLAEQNVFNAQLNHITAARNPADVREWIETARRTRPRTFRRLRETAEGVVGYEQETVELVQGVVKELDAIENLLGSDPEAFSRLFQALAVSDRAAAERAQSELVKREADGAQRMRAIKERVAAEMQRLTASAQSREKRAMYLLLALSMLTVAIGIATSIYARRVLRPLSVVTARAKAVAGGDLTPREAVTDRSEIGELSTTFEGMVAAIQKARSELVQAERLATIGKMAAHITHEIRNPLSSMGLNIELLEEEMADDDEEQAQLVAAIKSEVRRLSRIAEQYLSVARRPRPNLESECVEDLIRELLTFVRVELERADVAVSLEVEEDVPEAHVDESQFRQAMLNLIRNAREAIGEGGEIRISVTSASGEGVDITVDDDGPGIPDEQRAAIFDPFFTTKERGTGLGLAVTREIFEAHGGEIVCESLARGGTRFRIHLLEAPSAA